MLSPAEKLVSASQSISISCSEEDRRAPYTLCGFAAPPLRVKLASPGHRSNNWREAKPRAGLLLETNGKASLTARVDGKAAKFA